MKTFAIVNRKGGVGKTTTAIELAHILATVYGRRVLLVDADSQMNATGTLLGASHPEAGLAEVLQAVPAFLPDVIAETDIERLDVMPATEALGDYELEVMLGRKKSDFQALRRTLEELAAQDAYDAAVIDCPPYYSVSCLSALAACDSVIIPAGLDAYSTVGMEDLIRQISNIRQVRPNMHVSGVLVTQWHKSDVAEDAVVTLRESSPVRVFDTVIRRTDKAVEASWAGRAVGGWSPYCSAARDYRAWVAELLAREEM